MKLLESKPDHVAGVYIIRNIINGKYYAGESLNLYDRISHHKIQKNQVIHKAIKKYGIDNFEIYIEYLPDFKKEDLLLLEEQLIVKFNSMVPNGYNVISKGASRKEYRHSKEAKEKIRQSRLGKKLSETSKEKLSKFRKGRPGTPLSEEHKEKLRASTSGRKYTRTPEQIENMRRISTGKKHSEETKLKMSLSRTGKKHPPRSEECLKKLSIAAKGRIPTEETRMKRRESMLRTLSKKKEERILLEEQKIASLNPV